MRILLAALLLFSSSASLAADRGEIEGTWAYQGSDAFFMAHFDRDGKCTVSGSNGAAGYFSKCSYTLQWPDVYVQRDAGSEPLRLVLVDHGELMQVEGDAGHPLKRDREAPATLPPQVNLEDPGAMEAFAARDPAGHRRVEEAIDFVNRFGCQGAFLGELKKLLEWEFIGCASKTDPRAKTVIGFRMGEGRYLLEIPRGNAPQ